MKKFDIEQNTPEWFEFRHNHIGASDVSSILGINPYKTIYEVYKDKTENAVHEENEDTKRGHDKEPLARMNFVKTKGIELMPTVVESDEYSFISSSLDGISEDDKFIYEAKAPKYENYLKAVNAPIPPMHLIQIQTQLWVTKAEKCFYNPYWSDDENFVIEVLPDLETQQLIVEKCKWFWDLVQNRGMEFNEAEKVASEWKALKLQQKENELKLAELESVLKIQSQNKNFYFPNSGVEISWISKPGSISYAKVCKELNVPKELLDKYRGNGSFYATFNIAS